MKNGKKITRSQRNVLLRNGVKDTDNYLYITTEISSKDGNKSLNKMSGKLQKMIFLNVAKNTTETYDI